MSRFYLDGSRLPPQSVYSVRPDIKQTSSHPFFIKRTVSARSFLSTPGAFRALNRRICAQHMLDSGIRSTEYEVDPRRIGDDTETEEPVETNMFVSSAPSAVVATAQTPEATERLTKSKRQKKANPAVAPVVAGNVSIPLSAKDRKTLDFLKNLKAKGKLDDFSVLVKKLEEAFVKTAEIQNDATKNSPFAVRSLLNRLDELDKELTTAETKAGILVETFIECLQKITTYNTTVSMFEINSLAPQDIINDAREYIAILKLLHIPGSPGNGMSSPHAQIAQLKRKLQTLQFQPKK